MSNMSYCHFQNTKQDLADCLDHLYDEVSEDEAKARHSLIKIAWSIVEDFIDDEGNLDTEAIEDLQTNDERVI